MPSDLTGNAKAVEEFLSFLKDTFPHYQQKLVTIPISFQYELGNQHGIPSKGKEIRQGKLEEEDKAKCENRGKGGAPSVDSNGKVRGGKQKKETAKSESEIVHDWVKKASGQYAEQRVFDMLEKRFSKECCLLVNGFNEKDLVKVIKENIIYEEKQNQRQNKAISEQYFTQKKLKFYKLTNRHFSDLEEQVTNLMETIQEETFTEENIPQLSEHIKARKPGFDLLSESNKKNYTKNVEDLMKKKCKDGKIYKRSQLKDFILEHFLIKTDQNSEYDLLLFLKVRSISFHFYL